MELLPGLDAAPEGVDPEAWTALVAPAPSAALRAQLAAWRARSAPPEAATAALPRVPSRAELAQRLAALRHELSRRGLAGFVVPRADEHQGEYVPPRAERLAWLTGFTGSAGAAVVLADEASLFVDGRYTLQAPAQVNPDCFACRHLVEQPPEPWIASRLKRGDRFGFDPWLHTVDGVGRLRAALEPAGIELVACPDNPLDAAWADQPPPPLAPVLAQALDHAGRDAAEKRQAVGTAIAAAGAAAAVLTQPDSIAWLLNIRGGDVPHTPLPLSFALAAADGSVELFIDRRKLVPGLERHLGNGVAVQPPDALGPALDRLGAGKAAVLLDPSSAALWLHDRLAAAGAKIVRGDDPCALPKACKNAVEIAGTTAAHRRDGAAVSRFLAWLAANAPGGAVDELAAAERLLGFRRADPLFRDLSFDTISGAGPNGAIVHYRSSPATNRRLAPGELYLVDSGAQYLDGTTDITRTVAVGTPSAEMRDRFTRVLKGHIALGSARFPRGTTGSQLDVLARTALWQAGLDYDHGTGHGVGSYLGVHEGPQRISKLPNRVPLEVGMIVSNEPGYYKTGGYGIRIENLVTVVAAEVPGGERPMLAFETLTLAPIDRALVEPALLSEAERAWLDAYHARVRETLTPLLDAETAAWLAAATAPIAAGPGPA
ncbi:MAG: aminopeptidase P family protein [Dongiaceae bacterium]